MATRCFACYKEGTVKMCVTNIPQFKETVIMAFNCDFCGAKSNEIRGGGSMSERGKKITLKVANPYDLSRFIIKSDTSSIDIPEIGLQLSSGTLGALVTTLEGMIEKINEELERNIGFVIGDSQESQERIRFNEFLKILDDMKKGIHPEYTFILDDPLGNSYITGVGENDPQVATEEYERSEEQNEELGISGMNVNNYSNGA